MGSIFGGSKQKSNTYNQAYGTLSNAMAPVLSNAQEGLGGLSALLGGDASGFNKFKSATGFDAAALQGSQGITGNAAAAGLLRSGGTGKSLMNFNNNLQNQFASTYMDKLLAKAQGGFNAGQILAGAGNVNNQTSKSKNGLGGLIGTAITGGL